MPDDSKKIEDLIDAHLDAHPPRLKRVGRKRTGNTSAQSLARAVRSGGVQHDDHIDLHGMTVAQAWQRLQWLMDESRPGTWVIRVVTGKGLNSKDGRAVLAQEIPARLRADDRVLEVVQAVKARDGGQGAWFFRFRVGRG